MAHGQSPAGDAGSRASRRGAADLAARLALVAVLLAVVLAGIRAVIPHANGDHGPWHSSGAAIGIALEAVLIVLLIALEMGRRRRPDGGPLVRGLRLVLRVALVIGVVGLPIALLASSLVGLRKSQRPFPQLARPHPPTQTAVPHRSGGGGGPDLALILYGLLAAALLAAIVACVLLVRRRARAADIGDLGEVLDDEDPGEEELRRAVQSARAALSEVDDARLAIIACYVAMEQSLARAGTARADTETPDELLARAAAAGVVQGREAARLTELFYEARFSSHPVPAAHRDEARAALEVLAADLRDKIARRAAEAAAAAQAAEAKAAQAQAQARAAAGRGDGPARWGAAGGRPSPR
jgi:hypothetical protein